jgi:hypothetical protein
MFAFSITACSTDDNDPILNVVNAPDSYEWLDVNGESTVSFSGQTTRLKQAAEICSMMGSSSAEYNALYDMFNAGEGFEDASLNYSVSGKNVAGKTVDVDRFNALILEFTTDVVPVMIAGTPAEAGVAGVLDDDGSTRELNSKGMELDQVFTKGLIGALCGDQIINKYLSDSKIGDDVANTRPDEGGYTTMEHHWDEGYGYLYGMQADYTTYDVLNTNGDVLLYKYYAKSNFTDIQGPMFEAFKTGREAITMDADNGGTTLYSEEKMREADIVKGYVAHIIGQKAYDYLNGAAAHLEANGERDGAFFHDLSEGVGFVVALQATPQFTADQVAVMYNTLSEGNGLWDITADELNAMTSDIATAFSL